MRRLIYLAILLCLALPAAPRPVRAEEERRSGYYTMVDNETGQVICRTGMVIYPGDQYLTGNNLLYRVVRLEDNTAYAKFLGREELQADEPAVKRSWLSMVAERFTGFLGLARQGNGLVAIYHTHSDESYVPTDGTESKPGRGGIYRVGSTLVQRLKQTGVMTVQSRDTFYPHDGMAYERSRRTAVDLLRKRPAALFDIHRDAAPRNEYADRVNNEGVTKVQIVLGRSNPNLKANEAFAKRLKAVIDRKYPGLIKGIFYGHGKYNQDLSPRALLLEFGAHTNARESAERGAAIFASAATDLVGGAGGGGVTRGESSGAWRSVLYVLLGVAGLAVVFLLLNAGSLSGAGRNLGRFFSREFASALGDRRRRKKSGKDEGPEQKKPE